MSVYKLAVKLNKLPHEVREMPYEDFLTMLNCMTIIDPPPSEAKK